MSVDILGKAETNAEAWFNIALRPRKPEGSLGRTAQDGHLDSHTAPELSLEDVLLVEFIYLVSLLACPVRVITDNSGQLLCQCVTSFDS